MNVGAEFKSTPTFIMLFIYQGLVTSIFMGGLMVIISIIY